MSDVEFAVEEAVRLISQGFTSSNLSNDTGGFSYELNGEEVKKIYQVEFNESVVIKLVLETDKELYKNQYLFFSNKEALVDQLKAYGLSSLEIEKKIQELEDE
jgi:hypothetical protein